MRKTGDDAIPGDLDHAGLIDRFLRVNQAGELGAVRIYQGQRAILGRKGGPTAPLLKRMAEQEQEHLDTFSHLIGERRTRPTVLSPLWHLAGFALGAGTALLGEKAAMACTVAVEETIDEHYARQAEQLGEDEAALKDTIRKFREDEIEHRDIGLAHGAEQAPAYPLLSSAIKGGCRLAIWLSERI
ncbi:demethoxyubiquinone hydroxylase family protein [Paramagnetospirillum magneticum]|uniref:3-demethoxyubiquinol 3-hydroxylase n=1 Tax=Paramagnetospirillum magneticum (strain ATCC 700264 / AMB-1) TaxID=342108 RepID=Q2W739_PARM1|nr:demethoxyubiquinone hydroxylase family protein [Paramagnetospirillum magneticum]BAE50336.1 Ubiquinone biosynthesis protein COQ7 [Paramagnetospirillum magneticum AMB-1]